MRKLFNRPALALAAALALIFVIILIKSYCKLVDQLTTSLSQIEKSEADNFLKSNESQTSQKLKSTSSEVIGPQLPKPSDPFLDKPITYGTFEALNVTRFLRDNVRYEMFYKENESFFDLQEAVKKFKAKKTDEDGKADTFGDLLDVSYSTSSENSLTQFHSEISRYRMYSKNSKTVEELLYDMQTQGVSRVAEIDGGTQFKLVVTFDNGVEALFKPMRVSREQEALPNQIYFAEYERHTSEIAAFHLDRILDFRRAMPVVGRNMNLITEIMRLASPALQRTFFISPKPDENLCLTGTCKQFCDGYHPICGNGTFIEGSLMALFPDMEGAERKSRSHPWAQSYSKENKAPWETDPDYCDKIIELDLYKEGRLLLDLIDLSIFDFLIGNMDRHNFQRFVAFGNDTFVLRYDHGRAFGKAFHDELKILAPLLQCCLIRSSTLEMLLDIHNNQKPLSQRMRESLAEDPLAPILWEPHLKALDRRLMIVLQVTRDCISRYSKKEVLVPRESVIFD